MKFPAEDFFATIVNALPSPVFVVDRDVRIMACNEAGFQMLHTEPELVLQKRSGEVLHCINATVSPKGCGGSPNCRTCVIRNAVKSAAQGQKVVRQRARMRLGKGSGEITEKHLVITAAPFESRGENLVLLTIEDISELLKALLPICAHCKKIRDGQEYWRSLEGYFLQYHNIEFSHGICPQCAQEHYPEQYALMKSNRNCAD